MKHFFAAEFTPVPKLRPRTRLLNNGRRITYTPPETQRAEAMLKAIAKTSQVRPLAGPLRLRVTVYLRRPLEHTGAQKLVRWVTTYPDWDNYGKLASDALNGVAWKDDGQVSIGTVEKLYIAEGEHERWEILVEELLPAEAAA